MLKKMMIMLAVVILILMACWQPHFLNNVKPGFYFEKYKSAAEAQAALLKLHPVGSSVDVVIKTLEKAGAKKIYKWHGDKNNGQAIASNILHYHYKHSTFYSIFYRRWLVAIYFDDEEHLLEINILLEQGA